MHAWMDERSEWKAEPALVFQTVINWNTVKVNAKKKLKKRREYVWQEMKVTQIFSGASKQPIKNLSLMKLN